MPVEGAEHTRTGIGCYHGFFDAVGFEGLADGGAEVSFLDDPGAVDTGRVRPLPLSHCSQNPRQMGSRCE